MKPITFIDLFAGIGGFHFAFHNLGAKCVFASEWDAKARKTYEHNFQKISPELFEDFLTNKLFAGDITKINPEDIPDHDILTGGFPCQPFSQAGHKKGFEDTRGTLFFNIAAILEAKKPKAFFLENVRGLLNHDEGKTIKVIERVLNDLGYSFFYKIIKASDFGLPQHRPRLYMVGFKNPNIKFEFPKAFPLKTTMSDIFGGATVNRTIGFTLRLGGKGSKITDRRNWDCYLVDGKERRITPFEGKKMQGFPDEFEFPVSNADAMKQLGNSVAIAAIQATAKKIIEALSEEELYENL